jgi:hypothetical protein
VERLSFFIGDGETPDAVIARLATHWPGYGLRACVAVGQKIQTGQKRQRGSESMVRWLPHRRMNAQRQMRWSPRGAHLMLKVRTSVVNGTLDRDHAVAERWARRPFRRAA